MEIVLPDNLKNEILIFLEVIEEIQMSANTIIQEITSQFKTVKITPPVFIGILILKRVLECTNSIKILALLGLERDVSILLLNLIELRLDIMYIELDEKNADEWLNHEKEYEKPWKVRYLFNKLYKNQNELQAELTNYKNFSMAKHGNPVGGLQSFPLEISKRRIIFRKKDGAADRIAVYLFACGTECCNVSTTVIKIAQKYGFDLNRVEHIVTQLKDMFRKLNSAHTYEMLYELINKVNKPELCKNCDSIPKDVLEITCLLRQSKWQTSEEEIEFQCNKHKPIK